VFMMYYSSHRNLIFSKCTFCREEKDTSEWCRERLQKRLKETKAEGPGSLAGTVTNVEDITGDASVAIVSGKKRYIFDFHCKVKFEIKDIDNDKVIAKGKLKLPDICSTHHDELEVDFDGWKKSPSSEYEQASNDCKMGLVSEIRESVKLWVEDFNNHY
jgi:activator of HSP90 ATPase